MSTQLQLAAPLDGFAQTGEHRRQIIALGGVEPGNVTGLWGDWARHSSCTSSEPTSARRPAAMPGSVCRFERFAAKINRTPEYRSKQPCAKDVQRESSGVFQSHLEQP